MNKSAKRIIALIMAVGIISTSVGCSRGNDNGISTDNKGYTAGTYLGKATGNGGEIKVEVIVSDGKVSDIKILEHSETKGLGDSAMEAIGEVIKNTNSTNVETVSGATVSSNAMMEAVKDALRQAGGTDDTFSKDEKQSLAGKEMQDEYTFDVVVVGAGGAGLSAAVEAAQSGAKVVVIEKTMFAGGNTLVSGGGLNVPGTEQQIANGIEDSVELFTEDTIKGGDNENDPELVKVMAENALDAANWLINDMGVELMPDRLQQFGGHSVPRALIPKGNKGTELINKLKAKAEELGVEFFMETSGKKLVEENGVIKGVVAENKGKEVVFNADKGVILATGGFGADVEMRKKYNDHYDEKYKTTCTEASTGDGIKMAEEVGANLVDMEFIQVYPTCSPVTGIISYVANSRFDGAILVNQEGKRFVDEMGRRDVISKGIIKQTDSIAYLIWGQEVETVGNMVEVHSKEYETMEKDGVIFKADSIEEAAEHYGISKEALIETINRFNGFVAEGKDGEFNKGGTLRSIAEGPFYIQKVTPSTHHTMGGININTNAEVINKDGKVIENLYAAGEVVGDIHGTNRLGGNAITDIVVFGRIAGQNVVK
ncbi:Fumarate reductase flavoprotein subunit precursor [uncultured Clostridium sp.]|uniref:flavocytochrome c n=1 Tax=uncultured Clostridium sp. TaxID=59620 RepID=UPI000822EF0D|nr:flavocytochrome c [uncultured Clostridium sp.]SCI71988.1 Fumarate reductase flavoprotein subunit precursor [uncultured Clostridium sp.]